MKGHVVKKRKKGRSQKRLSKVSQHITKCLYHPTKTMTAAFTWLTKKKNLNCKYNVALCFTLWHVTVCALWTLHMGWHPESNMKNCLLQFCTILMKLEACADSLQLITYSPEHTSGIARSDLGTKDQLPVFSTKHKEMKNSKAPKIVPWNYSLDIKKNPNFVAVPVHYGTAGILSFSHRGLPISLHHLQRQIHWVTHENPSGRTTLWRFPMKRRNILR